MEKEKSMKEEIFQEKVADIIQENDNLDEIEAVKAEFKDFRSKPVFLPRPGSKVIKLLFSFDNMGLSTKFDEHMQSNLFDLLKKVKHFSEKKELAALLDDVTLYLKYKKEFPADLVQTTEQNEEVEIEERITSLEDQREATSNPQFAEMYEEEFVSWEKQGRRVYKNHLYYVLELIKQPT